MLVFRILGTIFVGLSCLTAMFKNINIFGGRNSSDDWFVAGTTVWGWLWRAFVIVALWVI
jgi:hypothetical protein